MSDGHGGLATATVDLNLSGVNDAPVVMDESLNTLEDEVQVFAAADLLANDGDADVPYGDVLQIASVQDAEHGTVALNEAGDVVFTPEADYSGVAGFSYTVQDTMGVKSTAHMTMQVAAVNDDPVAQGNLMRAAIYRYNLPHV